jgi:hypothetical protein
MEAARDTRLVPWVTGHPMRALRLAGAWDKLLDTVRWIEQRQALGMYLRQIDVPGVDTKFIERYRATGTTGSSSHPRLPHPLTASIGPSQPSTPTSSRTHTPRPSAWNKNGSASLPSRKQSPVVDKKSMLSPGTTVTRGWLTYDRRPRAGPR